MTASPTPPDSAPEAGKPVAWRKISDVERALSELIDKIVPGLDSGDILADAATASKALDKIAPEDNALRKDHPLAEGVCTHGVNLSENCRSCLAAQPQDDMWKTAWKLSLADGATKKTGDDFTGCRPPMRHISGVSIGVLERAAERSPIDANALEAMAKERPDEMFLKGSGVLKLLGAIRQLEQEIRSLQAATPSADAVDALRLALPCVERDLSAAVKENFGRSNSEWAIQAVEARDAIDAALSQSAAAAKEQS